jgi:hypothetical protein
LAPFNFIWYFYWTVAGFFPYGLILIFVGIEILPISLA